MALMRSGRTSRPRRALVWGGNGPMRDSLRPSRQDRCAVIADWKRQYIHLRRHSLLGYLTPADYAQQCTRKMETRDSHTARSYRWGWLTIDMTDSATEMDLVRD